jgi:hypothetical protein
VTDTNTIGERGEQMVALALTTLLDEKPLFRPVGLNAKWPVADFIVELVDEPGKIFLLQVKTTQARIRPGKTGIPIDVSTTHLRQLLSAPVPAYLAAVHEPTEMSYIGVPRNVARTRSLPRTYDLAKPATLIALQEEVSAFWKTQTPFSRSTSRFLF